MEPVPPVRQWPAPESGLFAAQLGRSGQWLTAGSKAIGDEGLVDAHRSPHCLLFVWGLSVRAGLLRSLEGLGHLNPSFQGPRGLKDLKALGLPEFIAFLRQCKAYCEGMVGSCSPRATQLENQQVVKRWKFTGVTNHAGLTLCHAQLHLGSPGEPSASAIFPDFGARAVDSDRKPKPRRVQDQPGRT